MNTPRQQENPYMTATPVPRATAPLNAIGVLGDTQASITHAQNAIATYGYNLDAERDRAQQRVIKDTFYPYAVKQTDYMGQAGVLGAQGARMQAGSAALNQGLAIDQFDPLAGNQGITRDGNRILYGGIDAPTTANPTMTQEQKLVFNQRSQDAPYAVGGDTQAQGQLTPLDAAVAPAVAGSSPTYVGPYNIQAPSIPGIPSSVVGVTRQPQLRSGVTSTERDAALRSVQGISNDVRHYQQELAEANATLGSDPNWFLKAGAENRRSTAVSNLERLTPKLTSATAQLRGMVETPGPSELSEQFNNYNIPQAEQGTFGADAMPEAAPNATSFEPPLAMIKQAPALVQGFKSTAATYIQHAPGGPGGVEAALLINGLESDFRPGVKAGSSTATGGAQFVGKTWLDGARKWEMPWAKGKTDEEILALRASPPHMAQMERAMRMQNLSIATSDKYAGKFDPYNPLNLYAMHHFHPERGADLAASLRTRPNASVASVFGPKYWNTALAANPHLAPNGRSMTVAELYTYWINEGKKRGFYGGVTA